MSKTPSRPTFSRNRLSRLQTLNPTTSQLAVCICDPFYRYLNFQAAKLAVFSPVGCFFRDRASKALIKAQREMGIKQTAAEEQQSKQPSTNNSSIACVDVHKSGRAIISFRTPSRRMLVSFLSRDTAVARLGSTTNAPSPLQSL